jgi:hypothetical protein
MVVLEGSQKKFKCKQENEMKFHKQWGEINKSIEINKI